MWRWIICNRILGVLWATWRQEVDSRYRIASATKVGGVGGIIHRVGGGVEVVEGQPTSAETALERPITVVPHFQQ